jgi:hypothetical protein
VWAGSRAWDQLHVRRIYQVDVDQPFDSKFLDIAGRGRFDWDFGQKLLRKKLRGRIRWIDVGQMHYPSIHHRICGEGEEVEAIDPSNLEDVLVDHMGDERWMKSIQTPTLLGLRGKPLPHAYLGGYPLAAGNGWDLHHPKRRSLINLWFDSGVLWHLCVSVDNNGNFGAAISCNR